MGAEQTPRARGPRAWISSHVKLYGLARALRYHFSTDQTPSVLSRDFAVAVRGLTPTQRRYALPFEDSGWRTILTPPYRARVLDDRDPRIRAGFESSVAALLAIHERCRTVGVPLLVVLLPTKESVFWPRVRDTSAHLGLARLVADETRLRGELLATLDRAAIPHVDPLHALTSSPTQTHFEDIDGHPNEHGHMIIAGVVAKRVERMLSRRTPPPGRAARPLSNAS